VSLASFHFETITNRGLTRPGAENGSCDAPVFPARCRILLRFPLADRLPIGGQPWLPPTTTPAQRSSPHRR
jgi:hypothetical protein